MSSSIAPRAWTMAGSSAPGASLATPTDRADGRVGRTQPARPRAAATCVHKRLGSLSALSSDTHAVGGRSAPATHWAREVVFP